MIDLIRFGRLVGVARHTKSPRISQVQLAKLAGVTQSFISDLENGRLRLGPRDPDKLEKIAEILEISTEEADVDSAPLGPTETFGYLPPPSPPGSLREKLLNGQFVVTMEIHPPKGVGLKRFESEAMELKEFADAVNVTDNQRALLKLSPVASARVLLELGIEPICQIACRDRNRLCLQSDILSAYVLGVRNFFIIMGDPPEIGDHPDAQPVFDLHSVQMLEVTGRLRMGFDMAGNRLNKAPRDIFLGSACNPFATDRAVELSKMRAKIRAGAEFFQTQPVYDVDGFRDFLRLVKPFGARVIAGYIPILDEKTLEILSQIPGIALPQRVRDRLEKAGDVEREGMAIAKETIQGLLGLADGIHMMNIARVTPSVMVMKEMRTKLGR